MDGSSWYIRSAKPYWPVAMALTRLCGSSSYRGGLPV
jgi:hypothetical protein